MTGTRTYYPWIKILLLKRILRIAPFNILIAFAFAIVFSVGPFVLSAQRQFKGEGWAEITGADMNIPRRDALQAALSRAVEEAVGSLAPLNVFMDKHSVIESRILRDPKKYIESQTVIAESKEENRYHIVVIATIRMDVLRADLVSLGLLLPESRMPKWIVIAPDRSGDGAWRSRWFEGGGGISASEAALEDAVRGYGYRVAVMEPQGKRLSGDVLKLALAFVDAQAADAGEAPKAVLEFARARGATHLLLGKGEAHIGDGLNGPLYALGTASLKLVAIEASSGKSLGAISGRAAVETLGNTGLDARVLRMAARNTNDELTKIFNTVNPTGSAAGFTTVTILLSGVTAFEQYSAINKALEHNIRGVRQVIIKKLAPGEVLIEVRFAGEAQTLVTELTKLTFENFTIKEESSENGIFKLQIH